MRDEFRAALAASGHVHPEHLERLAAYGALVLDANTRFNLTGATSVEEFVPHILDSIEIAPHVHESLVDVGSGGGLPAIPLAIVTGVRVTMVETTIKKVVFLNDLLERLELKGTAIAERAEVAGHDPTLRERFATATAKAVASAPTVAEFLLPFLAIGGKALLQRGTIDEREFNALADAAVILGAHVVGARPESSKSVIIVEKNTRTPSKYPRRVGVPAKKPLCY